MVLMHSHRQLNGASSLFYHLYFYSFYFSYEERIDRVEARITTRLRDQLGIAKNANEMFLVIYFVVFHSYSMLYLKSLQIFSRYNALFVRPHIRGAIREYQTQLISRVKEDIRKLQEQFTVHYKESIGSVVSDARDVPPNAGLITWIRQVCCAHCIVVEYLFLQIDRQLISNLKRVEDVLGQGYENHVEGQALKQEADNFRRKLDTQRIFDQWLEGVTSRKMDGDFGKV
jgi:dynein heavy chain 1